MYIVCVTVNVKPDQQAAFIKATQENARNTRAKETKNVRFDVLQCIDDKNRFFLYECYTDESGMAAHKGTAHYQKWRDSVEPMMAKPREGIRHIALYPETTEEFEHKRQRMSQH